MMMGCSGTPEQNKNDRVNAGYAKGFTIEKTDEFPGWTKLTVYNPWEKATNVSMEYYLAGKDIEIPGSLADKKIIRTPAERVICLSTTHLAFLDILGENPTVAGISGSKYITNPGIRSRMENGEVPDVGYGQNLNFELIVSLKPDVILVYGIGSEVTSYSRKLDELGIPVLMVGEYLEESPLGKAEWLKFISVLFNKEELAEEYFTKIEAEYNRLSRLVTDLRHKPKVLVGSPYKDSWWVPGGNSYLSNLIKDAGGEYLGERNDSHESYVISFEHALAWGSEADVWINMSNLSSKKEILGVDERFTSFRVFREGILFNNIKRLSTHGGNDFWESGTVNPHLILRDLIAIFHPGLINDELVYYQEIE